MADTGFRLWLGSEPATLEELARVEEIVVEQEMDVSWEARIRLSLCLDEAGHWKHDKDEFNEPFSRIRVEMVVDGSVTPLIDGSVASVDTAMDPRPGRSSLTLVVQDDRFLLDRVEAVDVREQATEAALAAELFDELPQAETPHRIQPPDNDPPRNLVRRGSPMAFLAGLARARHWHAYVLPGSTPGSSIGCYLPDPNEPPLLPPLTLMGSGRNLDEVQVNRDGAGPQATQAHTLRDGDGQVESQDTAQQESTLLRDFPAVPLDRQATRLLPPEENHPDTAAAHAAGRSARAAGAYRLSGKVVPGCYSAVLSPYNRITLRAGDSPLSGDWLLTKVTHHITPSLYTQDIEARSDSQADTATPPDPAGGAGGCPWASRPAFRWCDAMNAAVLRCRVAPLWKKVAREDLQSLTRMDAVEKSPPTPLFQRGESGCWVGSRSSFHPRHSPLCKRGARGDLPTPTPPGAAAKPPVPPSPEPRHVR